MENGKPLLDPPGVVALLSESSLRADRSGKTRGDCELGLGGGTDMVNGRDPGRQSPKASVSF